MNQCSFTCVLRFYTVSKCFLKWVFMQPWCSYALFLYRRFPNYYYSLSYNIPGGGVVQILMIDTVLLCGNTGDDSLHDQPHGPVDLDKADDQLAWITQSMKNSRYSRSYYSSSSCAFSVLTLSMNIKMTRDSVLIAAWNTYLWFDEIRCISSPVVFKLECLSSCHLGQII